MSDGTATPVLVPTTTLNLPSRRAAARAQRGEAMTDERPYTMILVVSSDGYGVFCTCGFEEPAGQPYRAAYDLADAHLTTHYGPRPRTKFPLAPCTVGGLVAINPDAGEAVIREAGRTAMAFVQWCYAGGWEDRVQDPEAFYIFLESVSAPDQAAVTEYRAAFRATGLALGLEQLPADPDWRTHLYDIAGQLIEMDDADAEGQVVVQGDGLTLAAFAKLLALVRAHRHDEEEVTALIPPSLRHWMRPDDSFDPTEP